MPEKHVVDTYGPIEFFREMIDEFGAKGAMNLVGWLGVFGATGGKTHAEMVKRLIEAGFAKSSVYDASVKIRRFQQRLYENRGVQLEVLDLAGKVSEELQARASGKAETVLQ